MIVEVSIAVSAAAFLVLVIYLITTLKSVRSLVIQLGEALPDVHGKKQNQSTVSDLIECAVNLAQWWIKYKKGVDEHGEK